MISLGAEVFIYEVWTGLKAKTYWPPYLYTIIVGWRNKNMHFKSESCFKTWAHINKFLTCPNSKSKQAMEVQSTLSKTNTFGTGTKCPS